jgi:hypothetical protein
MSRRARKLAVPIFDPVEEARALAFHLGREDGAQRQPLVPAAEAAADLHTAEIECLMQQTPNDAPIRRMSI